MSTPTDMIGVGGLPMLDGALSERFTKPNYKDIQEIVDWANKQYTAIKNNRAGIERQWYLNLAFYFGKQNVAIRNTNTMLSGPSGSLFVPPAPYFRSRPVINRVRPMIRTELTKLTAQKPSAFIVPASSEDRDMFAAQAGEQIWESIYRRKKIAHGLRRTLFWTLNCGTAFLKAGWNPDLVDRDSNQMGDFEFTPVTPFHLFAPDFRTEELEEQPYVIHAQMKSREQLELMFQGKKFNAPDKSGSELIDDSWLNMMGASSLNDKKSVLVLECWVKPGMIRLFPEGAFYTIVGESVVQGMEGWPYQHSMFPFAKIDHIPSGKFYADASTVDFIPLQREYNRTRGQIIEAKNRTAKPQLMAPRGSVDPSKITSEPGLVILYTPGFDPPTPLPLTPLPNYVADELDRLLMDMSDISGQHEITKGQVPPGVTAATAISYLQEQDESKLSHTYASVEEALEKVAHITLSYVSQYWDYPRTVKLVGTDGSFDVLAFKGSDLHGNDDIRVEAGSALPTSKAAKQAFVMDLMKMGFIDPNLGLEVMDMGGLNKIYEKIQVDVRQAQRENLRMAAATPDVVNQFNEAQAMDLQMNPQNYYDPLNMEPKPPTYINPMGEARYPLLVPVNTFDQHRVHIEVHDKYRKSQAYETLDQAAKDLFELHVKYHVEQIVIGQMAAAPMGMMAGDTAPAGIQEQENMNPEGGPEGLAPEGPPMPEGGGESGIPINDSAPS